MLCAGYFEAKGYSPETTRIGADGGIDIILHRKGDPTGKTFGVVQCKAWSRAPVGIKPVRELFGVKAAEEVPLAVFMTTTDYTNDAKTFAEGKKLRLISGMKLVELLRGLREPAGIRGQVLLFAFGLFFQLKRGRRHQECKACQLHSGLRYYILDPNIVHAGL